MTIDLSQIKPARAILPPRLVVYGSPKVGKTSFAASIPNNLILDIEGGSGALAVARVEKEKLTALSDVFAVLDALAVQEHSFGAVTIDSADWLETLIGNQIAAEAGKRHLEDIPYQAGHKKLPDLWKQVFDKLTLLRERRGMVVLFVAHDQVKRYDSPITESYDRHQLKMHKQSADILTEWVDGLLFANQRVHIDKSDVGFKKTVRRGVGGDRVLHTVESPAYVAGNRYGLPEELPLDWASFIEAFNQAAAA
jgi:hypothetical protein